MPANFATNYSLTLHTKNYHEERKCDKNQNPTRIVCECGNKYKNVSNYKDPRVQSMETLQDIYVKHVEHLSNIRMA